MAKIKAVIFDMDGLMFDTERIYYKANQKTADYLGMDFSFETYTQFIGVGDAGYEEKMRELYPDEKKLNEFFEKSQLVLEYLLLNGQLDMKEGLINLLEYLKRENIMAVVASSTKRALVEQLLRRVNIHQFFKEIVGGDEVNFGKPNPEIYNHAFERTGLSNKNEVFVLEDSISGVEAAHAADIPVIMVPDLVEPDQKTQAKVLSIQNNLDEVIQLLKSKEK